MCLYIVDVGDDLNAPSIIPLEENAYAPPNIPKEIPLGRSRSVINMCGARLFGHHYF